MLKALTLSTLASFAVLVIGVATESLITALAGTLSAVFFLVVLQGVEDEHDDEGTHL